ncbi:MAG: glycoside hydrolase family 31 protein [Lachnospiraceae bacterium]|nr:glycoside hydrolase family 31 protein [Lachnospiraceae bacterium]
MVRRYVFGTPIETDAVINKPEASKGAAPYVEKNGDVLLYDMQPGDIVYGLGENVRGINKRGWIYVSNCSDDPNHQEDTKSLYGAHNFIIVSGEDSRPFGLFLDTPDKIVFDIGYTVNSRMTISMDSGSYELYVIEAESLEGIVKEFRQMIGMPFLPPKWAFGFGQSRWSYRTSEEVREVVRQYRSSHIPIDSIYLDIDYMERYKDFTIDRERFPDFEKLVEELKEQGIHLVPIIDGGVKIEEGYEVYEEGVRNRYFCKDENGEDFVVGVWPGRCHFPDMLNDEARKWFGGKYKYLLDKGIDGFWNDMNEPAIFYSERRLRMVFDKIEEYRTMNLDVKTFFEFKDLVASLEKNPEDYRSFYHNYRGQSIRHDRVHNLFGYYMTRSAGEAFEELEPEKRILMFSRSSYIGMHRYGGVWTGDNKSWWSHLLMNLKMLPSLNMCGFLYSGADIGGFGSDATEDLVLRWLALGIFVPLMRNHAADGTRRQEAYAFGNTEAFAEIIGLRYRLLPYLYSEFMKAALKNEMYARPLGFVWPGDSIARRVEDQLMIGESIMIAPVYEQNAAGRVVYLPEPMKMLRFAKGDVTEEKVLPAGHHFVEIPLEEVVLFIRRGHILPLASGGERVGDIDWNDLKLYHFAGPGALYELYDDDGISRRVELEKNLRRLVL